MTRATISLFLLLFLLLVMPIWGWLDMRRLKRDTDGIALVRTYVTTIGVMWLLSVLVALLLPASVLWTSPLHLAERMRVDVIPPPVMAAFAGALLIGLIAPVILLRRRPEVIQSQLKSIQFMLPTTTTHRLLFALVCITAGICEEWIYRGFVLHFLIAMLPRLNGWLIVVASAVLFGIAHVYQGRSGTMLTGVLGFLLALLYVGTGNLLVPMILHALVDLRIFLLLPSVRTART